MPAALVAAGILAVLAVGCAPSKTDVLAAAICRSVAAPRSEPGQRVDLGALTLWMPSDWAIHDPGYFDHGGVVLGQRGELTLSNGYVGPTSFGEAASQCKLSINGLLITIHAFQDGVSTSAAAVVGERGDFESRSQPVLSVADASGQGLQLFLDALHSIERGAGSAVRRPVVELQENGGSTK